MLFMSSTSPFCNSKNDHEKQEMNKRSLPTFVAATFKASTCGCARIFMSPCARIRKGWRHAIILFEWSRSQYVGSVVHLHILRAYRHKWNLFVLQVPHKLTVIWVAYQPPML